MKTPIRLSRATNLATKIENAISLSCHEIKVVGSVRRQREQVGDIEFVCIPRLCPERGAQLSLLGDEPVMVSELDLLIPQLLKDKPDLSLIQNGPKQKTLQLEYYDGFDLTVKEVQIELYITTLDQWGYIVAMRTGPSDFSKAFVTQHKPKCPLISQDPPQFPKHLN